MQNCLPKLFLYSFQPFFNVFAVNTSYPVDRTICSEKPGSKIILSFNEQFHVV